MKKSCFLFEECLTIYLQILRSGKIIQIRTVPSMTWIDDDVFPAQTYQHANLIGQSFTGRRGTQSARDG
jgi:hypothetical protein